MCRARGRRALAVASCLVGCVLLGTLLAGQDVSEAWNLSSIENLRLAEYRFSEVDEGLWSMRAAFTMRAALIAAAVTRLVPEMEKSVLC